MDIANFIQSIIDPTQAKVLAILLVANFIGGSIAAIIKAEVTLADFINIWKRFLMVFGAYLTIAIAGTVLTDYEVMRTAAWAALIAYMTAQIASNLKDLGLPIPESVAKLLEKVNG